MLGCAGTISLREKCTCVQNHICLRRGRKEGVVMSGLRVSDVWFFVRVFLPDCVGTKMKMLNTIFSASLLSSGQQVFAVVLEQCFCGFPPIGKHCIRVFGSHLSKFRAEDEMPVCGLQFMNFIRYCPSGKRRKGVFFFLRLLFLNH